MPVEKKGFKQGRKGLKKMEKRFLAESRTVQSGGFKV